MLNRPSGQKGLAWPAVVRKSGMCWIQIWKFQLGWFARPGTSREVVQNSQPEYPNENCVPSRLFPPVPDPAPVAKLVPGSLLANQVHTTLRWNFPFVRKKTWINWFPHMNAMQPVFPYSYGVKLKLTCKLYRMNK